jgi:hypothetical protein
LLGSGPASSSENESPREVYRTRYFSPGEAEGEVRLHYLPSRDLLITKNVLPLQTFHSLHTQLPDINNLGKLFERKQQLLAVQSGGFLNSFGTGI